MLPIEILEPRRLFSTYTVNAAGGGNYSDLETAIVQSPAGSTLMVAPGTYTAHPTVIDGSASVFWINKPLTIVSTGGPSVTTLVAPAGQVQDVLISSGDVTVQGFSLQGGEFCADVQDFLHNTTLTNVTLRNLNLTPDATGTDGHGILYQSVADSVIDGCTVGLSYANGIFLDAGSDHDLVTNNTVTGTVTQHAIAVKNSDDARVLNNTVTGSAADGIILRTSSHSVVSGNAISGHRYDGITLTNDSDDDVVELNTVVSSQWHTGGLIGAGIWLNDDSDRNLVYANSVTGQPECGIDVFVSSDNTISGNDVFGNYEGGIFVFDALDYPDSVGAAPANNVITDNFIHDNLTNSGVVLRGTTNTLVQGNAIRGTFDGTYGSSTDGALEVQRSAGVVFEDNTATNLQTGINLYATADGVTVEHDRFVNCGENYVTTGATVTLDGGPTVGGNFWSNATPGTAFTNFLYDAAGHRGGGYADSYPMADESLAEPYAVTVTGPAGGTTVATGSARAITWTATGAAAVNIYYSSAETGDVLVASDRPNNGVYLWTVPGLPAGSDYTVKVVPLDSGGTAHGTAGVSAAFEAVGTGSLTLLAPEGGMVQTPGSTLAVAWAAQTPGTPVTVQLQEDGGDWMTVATGVTDDHTTITLPAAAAVTGRVRVLDVATGDGDTQDGSFRLAAAVPAVTDVAPAGSALPIGSVLPIAWTSPAGSRRVNVQYGGNAAGWQTVATTSPDVGSVDWLVPDVSASAAAVRVQYYDATGTLLGTATTDSFAIAGGTVVTTTPTPTPTTTPTPTPSPTTTPTPSPTPTVTPTPTPTTTVVPTASTSLAAGTASFAVSLSNLFGTPSAATAVQKLTIKFVPLTSDGGPVTTAAVKAKGDRVVISSAKLHRAGTYTVVLTNAGGATATQTLTIVAAAAVKVAFATVPATLTGQSAVTVRLTDKFGNLTTASDGATVTVRLAKPTLGKGAALAGTTTATVSRGVATFTNLSVTGATVAGPRGRLIATVGRLTSAASAPFAAA